MANPEAPDTQYHADLKIAIVELQARYARCNNKYDLLQTKFFALLAGEIAIATLLFSGYFENQALILPSTLSGKIFFFSAVGMFLTALGLAFISVSSNHDWAETPEMKRILDKEEIKAHAGTNFLERIVEDYKEAIKTCDDCFEKRTKKLVNPFVCYLGYNIISA